MRHWLAISLLCLHSLALLKPLAPVLFFQLQQTYIAEEFCQERFQEISFCGGKCVLQKALQKAFEESEQPRERSECRLQWLEHPSPPQKVLLLLSAPVAQALQESPVAQSPCFLTTDFSARLEKPPRMV